MKALAGILWVACLGAALALLFVLSSDRRQLDEVAKFYGDTSARRDMIVENIKELPALRGELNKLRPAPLKLRPGKTRLTQPPLDLVHVVGTQRDVVGVVADLLAQGYAAGDLTIAPKGKRQWEASFRTIDGYRE